MTAHELKEVTAPEIINKISEKRGLNPFAKGRSKFEGWLKVELIDTMIDSNVKPEVKLIDVSNDNIAIELKSVNTSYKYNNVDDGFRPVTYNIDSVLADIRSLKQKSFDDKFVVFTVFPLNPEHKAWKKYHIHRIQSEVEELVFERFKFNNGVDGVIYYGKVI